MVFSRKEPQAHRLQWIYSDTKRQGFPSSLTQGAGPEDSPQAAVLCIGSASPRCSLVTDTETLPLQRLTD